MEASPVVRVEVDVVIPAEDPSEPCYEPATLKFLDLVREKADAGDVAWLRTVGEVYARVPALRRMRPMPKTLENRRRRHRGRRRLARCLPQAA